MTLRVGIAGLGTVGAGVARLLRENAGLVTRRAGQEIVVTAVSARDRHRERGVPMAGLAWEDDAGALARRDDVDVVVELMGGSDGPALTLARATLGAGRALVTANKAMMAHHGLELARLAEANGAALRFEAAVGGGVPVVKAVSEGASANRVSRVYGILNGTCNYILSRMEREGADFGPVLADAQALGFAEADPSFDVEGVDAAHKLAILASLAFGAAPDFERVSVTGITEVLAGDLDHAASLGFKVRLLGMAACEAEGAGVLQRVQPFLVPLGHPLAATDGPLNAVVVEGDFVGRLLFQGRGAGAGPTASAVVADLIDIARGSCSLPLGMPAADLGVLDAADPGAVAERFYLRMTVNDRPGVLAELTAHLRDAGVSIESVLQRAPAPDGSVFVAMVTHEAAARDVRAALDAMAAGPSVTSVPVMMPILAD